MTTHKIAALVCLMMSTGAVAWGDGLDVCGATPSPGQNSVVFTCGSDSNFAHGTATETVGANFDKIVLTSLTFVGSSANIKGCSNGCMGGNTHPAFTGAGTLTASLDGSLLGGGSTIGGESFKDDVHANHFKGNDAIAEFNIKAKGLDFPLEVTDDDVENGFYKKSTQLTFTLTWNLPYPETLNFPTSIDMTAEVPEPSFRWLAAIALCAVPLAGRMRKAKAA
jgi:hypothetical protein